MSKQVRSARIVCWHDGQLLLQSDNRLAEHERFYRLPGGHMEAGETPAQCAAREADEELGAAVKLGPLWYVGWNDYVRKGRRVQELVFYYAASFKKRPHGREIPSRERHLDARMLSPEELSAGHCLPARLMERVLRDGPAGPGEVVYIEEDRAPVPGK